jgi:sulfate adenylyltransferase
MARFVLQLALLQFLCLHSGAAESEKATCNAHHGCRPAERPAIDTFVSDSAKREALVSKCAATLELSQRQACDVALLVNGGFSPLQGFMKKADYNSVVENMRTSGSEVLFGLPVILDVADSSMQGKFVLLTYRGTNLAVLEAEEVWEPNKVKEAKKCYGTSSVEHPSVQELFSELGKFYVGGHVHGLVRGFEIVWGSGFKTPAEVRATLPKGKAVVAFQNRNPVHKAHFELLVHAQNDVKNSIILVHPTCGPTQPGDIDGPTRIKTYEVMQEEPSYKKMGW